MTQLAQTLKSDHMYAACGYDWDWFYQYCCAAQQVREQNTTAHAFLHVNGDWTTAIAVLEGAGA